MVLRLQLGLRERLARYRLHRESGAPVGGVETYDAWTTGEIGFASPEVMAAGRLAHDLIFEPGFVRGGTAAISEEWFMSPFTHLLEIDEVTGETEAGCWLAFGADGMLGFAPANSEFGSDIGVFPLPPMNANQPDSRDRVRAVRDSSGRYSRGAEVHGVRQQPGVG